MPREKVQPGAFRNSGAVHDQALAEVLDGLPAAVSVVDPATHRILFANRLLRHRHGDIIGNVCHKALHGLDEPCPFCGMNEVCSGKDAQEHVREFQDGSQWYRAEAFAVDWPPGLRAYCEIACDISDEKGNLELAREASDEMARYVEKRMAEVERASQLLKKEIGRRKSVEDQLRDIEVRHNTLFLSAPDPIMILDVDGTVLDVNPALEKNIGITREEVLGRHFLETTLIERDELEKIKAMFSDMLLGQDVGVVEVKARTRHGDPIWLEAHPSVLKKGNKLVAFQVISRDITARKEAERIIHNKIQFEKTVSTISSRFVGYTDMGEAVRESLGDACGITGATRGYVFLKEEDPEWLSYTFEWAAPGETIHSDLMPRIPAGLLPWGAGRMSQEEALYIASVDDLPEEARAERKLLSTQGIRSVFMIPLKIGGEIAGYAGFNNTREDVAWSDEDRVLLRITCEIISTALERRRGEEALRRSEERFRRIAENSPDIILRWTPGQGMVYANPALERITGFTPEEIINTTGLFAQRIHVDDLNRVLPALQGQALFQQSGKPIEFRIMHKDGHYIWVETIYVPIRDDQGELVLLEMLARDITERKKNEEERRALQQQLVQAQKMEAIGTLAGGMAHEFNNMLAVILGTAELALGHTSTNDENFRRIQKIVSTSERARDITMKLLTFSRKEKLDVRSVPVNAILEELKEILQRTLTRKISVVTWLRPELPLVRVDVNQIQQALLNVCINAGDSMSDGGTLTIETDTATLDREYCAEHPNLIPGDYCLIRIQDTGHGMDADDLKKIFEPFYTTKDRGKGTGLGLSITLGIIKNHEGHIRVDSESDRGTTVTIYLPATGTPEEVRESPPSIGRHENNETVLIVDDEADFIDMAVESLEALGFHTMSSLSGREAVQLFEQRRNDIDVVILDMIMDDMDGAEVFGELKKIDPDVPVLLCSGFSMDGQAGELMKQGIRGFIQKPFNLSEISGKIRKALSPRAGA